MDDSTIEPLDSLICPKGPLSPRIILILTLAVEASVFKR
jgi:hypothetical protein